LFVKIIIVDLSFPFILYFSFSLPNLSPSPLYLFFYYQIYVITLFIVIFCVLFSFFRFSQNHFFTIMFQLKLRKLYRALKKKERKKSPKNIFAKSFGNMSFDQIHVLLFKIISQDKKRYCYKITPF